MERGDEVFQSLNSENGESLTVVRLPRTSSVSLPDEKSDLIGITSCEEMEFAEKYLPGRRLYEDFIQSLNEARAGLAKGQCLLGCRDSARVKRAR
jgi:hypothetical protein